MLRFRQPIILGPIANATFFRKDPEYPSTCVDSLSVINGYKLTDQRWTKRTSQHRPVYRLLAQQHLFCVFQDLYPSGGHTWGPVLQKQFLELSRGRGFLLCICGFQFYRKMKTFLYTVLHSSSWRDNILLLPANFRGARVIISVWVVLFYYQMQKRGPVNRAFLWPCGTLIQKIRHVQ